ncbi:MAG TPA: protein translocase subunit SecD [Vicinamibacteria bacterium]|nr:protein translocase subunit SecD [Vicinamibacteria bacterium]
MPPALQNPLTQWLLLTAALAGLVYAFMRPELRWRAILYGTILIACGVVVWPPYDRGEEPGKIHLGLDLKGGIHLVLQVKVDDALVATTDDAVNTVRDQAVRKAIQVASVSRVSSTSFAVDGIEPARVKDMQDILRDFFRSDWEVRDAGGGKLVVQMTDSYQHQLRQQTVQEAIRTIERRVNAEGTREPVIAATGSRGDEVLVQLPGEQDIERAKRMISTVGQLTLRLVENTAPTQETLLQGVGGKVPDNMDLLSGPSDTPGEPTYFLVRKEAMVTGRDLRSARVGVDESNRPQINFSIKPTATDRFSRETGRNIGRQLAIVLDNTVYSAPTIQNRLGAENRITGRFTTQQADEISKILKAGALPAGMNYLQQLSVGATLGRDSIKDGVTAAAAGMAFIVIFMVVYYKLSGVNAVVALLANLLILLAALAYSGATLTLPGIAGVILTMGVGVDTNVLVFERIREELRNGKTVRAAVEAGFDRVLTTIIDTHATALIAAAFLFQFGTGAIKGFAVTLVIGLIANVFASFFMSKFLFQWVLGKGGHVETLSI